ncbi:MULTISPECIES: hypothetical protein [unclassified Ketobacter]|uniref:hypothetical protein n=1 Tax=unclassified Ketobacter TaxID=2639109 RepID=UPI0025C26FE4|nr:MULTISPECIES: hypothetical protein [unclassified Ketobacter]
MRAITGPGEDAASVFAKYTQALQKPDVDSLVLFGCHGVADATFVSTSKATHGLTLNLPNDFDRNLKLMYQ